MSDMDGSLASADAAGLYYVSDDPPSIRRGRGFSYVRADGRPITAQLDRIERTVRRLVS